MSKCVDYPAVREKHSESGTILYMRWTSIKCRTSPKHKNRHRYYDRGITICKSWLRYSVFKKWALDNGYSPELELDRRNNKKGYSPSNCRWVTRIVNMSNRENTFYVNYKGMYKSLTLICLDNGLSKDDYPAIARRVNAGWDIEKALFTPIKKRKFGKTRSVVNTKTKEVFDSITKAAESIGVTRLFLSQSLSGIKVNKTGIEYL